MPGARSDPAPERFRALRVSPVPRGGGGSPEYRAAVEQISPRDLPAGSVLVRVAASSINYKDALSIAGAPGVTRAYPHTPGIDAAGEIVASDDRRFAPGDRVIVGGGEFGANEPGGYSEYVRVDPRLLVELPRGITPFAAMCYGTAGLTAAACVEEIRARVRPPSTVLVSGASGGVGSVAAGVLARLGYRVVAATGKKDAADYLRSLGVHEIANRDDILGDSNRPLLHARWDAVVDTVGGAYLTAAIRACSRNAVVTAVGNAAGADLPLTVYPFILRGIRLIGIDTPSFEPERRNHLYSLLAGDWRLASFESTVRQCDLNEVPKLASAMLSGSLRGRIVVRMLNESDETV